MPGRGRPRSLPGDAPGCRDRGQRTPTVALGRRAPGPLLTGRSLRPGRCQDSCRVVLGEMSGMGLAWERRPVQGLSLMPQDLLSGGGGPGSRGVPGSGMGSAAGCLSQPASRSSPHGPGWPFCQSWCSLLGTLSGDECCLCLQLVCPCHFVLACLGSAGPLVSWGLSWGAGCQPSGGNSGPALPSGCVALAKGS